MSELARPAPLAFVLTRISAATALFGATVAFVPRASAQCEGQRLWAPGGSMHHFGAALAADGDRAISGAPATEPGELDHVVLLTHTATSWDVDAVFTHAEQPSGARFGAAVAIEGDLALAGSPSDDLGATSTCDYGSVSAYSRASGAWQLEAELTAPVQARGAQFGSALALSGAWLFVGAPYQPVAGQPGAHYGQVHVYRRVGGAWTHWQALWIPSDPPAQSSSGFGNAIALDGARALIATSKSPQPSGIVYAYELVADTWTNAQSLLVDEDDFGKALALDGARAAVLSTHALSIYAQVAGAWTLEASVATPPSQVGVADSVVLDGERICVGCSRYSHVPIAGPAQFQSGAFALVEHAGGAWQMQPFHEALDVAASDHYGSAVAFAGAELLVGIKDGEPAGASASADIGGVQVVAFDGSPCAPFTAAPAAISVAEGGYQEFWLQAGAGQSYRYAFVLGSASGTAPGLALDGWVLPLNPDALFLAAAGNPNAPPYVHNFAQLDGAGRGYAGVFLPAASSASLIGLQLHHAYALYSPALQQVTFTSIALPLALVP